MKKRWSMCAIFCTCNIMTHCVSMTSVSLNPPSPTDVRDGLWWTISSYETLLMIEEREAA